SSPTIPWWSVRRRVTSARSTPPRPRCWPMPPRSITSAAWTTRPICTRSDAAAGALRSLPGCFRVKASGGTGSSGPMRVAVLGGGNGCYAAAADLSEAGHEVRFWRRDADAFKPVLETGTIRLRDFKGVRDVRIALPTADIGAAVRGAEFILAPMPAFAQHDLAVALAPHLTDGQVIYLPPGTFG